MFSPVIIGFLWTLIHPTFGDKPVNKTICNDTECNELVSQVKRQMGSSQPCDDFYNYTCGNWKGDMELKRRDIKVKAVKDLIVLLNNASKSPECHSNATDKLINAYNSCVTTGGDKEMLRQAVHSALSTYGLESWPIQMNNNGKKDDYKEILKKTGPRPLFRYFASEEGNTSIIFMTKQNEFVVFGVNAGHDDTLFLSREDISDTTTIDYSQYDQYEQEADEAYKLFVTKTIVLLNNTFQASNATKVAEDIIKFENNLSTFASEACKGTTRMNISKFIETVGDNVPMVEILNKDLNVINYTVHNGTEVEVQCVDYYKNVVAYMRGIPELSTLQNYIGWVLIRDMAKAEGTFLHEYYMEYKNKTSIFKGGEAKKEDNRTLCVRQLLRRDLMYTGVAQFYVKNKFDNHSRAQVMKILEYVNITFQYIVKNNAWMSQAIKNKSLKRLEEMNAVIGYPDWLWNNDTVDKLYEFVPKLEAGKSFVEHYFRLRENDHYQQLLKLKGKYFNKSYEEVVLKSHAFYDEDKDLAGYPAASLATHYRKPPIPRATNFGTIGTVLVHILSNAIDRYDKKRMNGSIAKTEFWDNITRTNFCNNSKCLNNSEQCSDAGADCNSQRYQKLHDYLGVRVAHRALQLSKDKYKEPFLLNDEALNTEDEIFFTFFGSLYCPYRVNENLLDEVHKTEKVQERADIEDVSFPDSLNEIVSIYDKFNSTFNCNGTMKDTCKLVPEMNMPSIGC